MLRSELDMVLHRLIGAGAPKVFILAILLLSWQSFFDLDKSAEYQVIEYYAGVARIARLSKGMGYRSAAYDVVYDTPAFKESANSSPSTKSIFQTTKKKGKSAMDLTTSAGFTLALAMALEGKVDQCVTFWGICCSSWIHMNSGASKRDYFTPMGCRAFQSVEMANLLVARSMLLILLCICMGGTPVVENPGSSLIWLHDRFQWLLGCLEKIGLTMYKQKFWMCYFGSPSMKRTILWSTGSPIAALKKFQTMQRKDFEFDGAAKTAEKYLNSRGEVAYKGTKALKGTQVYVPRFAGFAVRMIPFFNDPKMKQALPKANHD